MPQAVETPSGKGAADENFPVGSWLLPPALRPHIAVFYAYARAIDDVADNPGLSSAEKIERLDMFSHAVQNGSDDPALVKAANIRDSLTETGVTNQHCLDLIAAFKQDAVKSRYGNWDELMGYCNLSAAPVGRYLIDLHGESKQTYAASDALCNALQVINHLQDCADDYRELDRIYLPQQWMQANGVTEEDMQAPSASLELRRVLNLCLESTADLMPAARSLPGQFKTARFAMEAAAIVNIADKLIAKLRRGDPLAERVVLSKPQYLACGANAIAGIVWQQLFGR